MTSERSESINGANGANVVYSSENKSLNEIIAELKTVIDQIVINQTNARKLILELARRLDEGHKCERNQICRRIKDILRDKIRQGHITGKWVEDCLPAEYKRKYTKSEVTSLSKKAKKLQEMVVDNSGKVHAELVSPNGLQKEQSENIRYGDEGRCPRCSELEEAHRKAYKISTAEQLDRREIKVTISKDKYEEIQFAMQNSDASFYIVLNSANQSFVRAEPDISELIL
jgi:polyhydroxyalkanoate synthesis regulator phasin